MAELAASVKMDFIVSQMILPVNAKHVSVTLVVLIAIHVIKLSVRDDFFMFLVLSRT